jgi:type III secretion protein S
MSYSDIINDSTQAISLILVASLPPVLIAAVVGVLVSLVQALTQVQEQTLSFGFKLVAVILTLLAMMETLGSEFLLFTQYIFDKAALGKI